MALLMTVASTVENYIIHFLCSEATRWSDHIIEKNTPSAVSPRFATDNMVTGNLFDRYVKFLKVDKQLLYPLTFLAVILCVTCQISINHTVHITNDGDCA